MERWWTRSRSAIWRSGARCSAGATPLSDAEIHALFGPSEDGMMRRVLPETWQSALPGYFEEYERLLPTCPTVIPELGAALALLRERRIPTGLVTGKSHVTAAMSLRHFGLDDAFDAVEPGSPEGVVKAPAIRRLLERWCLRPEDAVYVGDGASDMRAAHEAGVIAAGRGLGLRRARRGAAGGSGRPDLHRRGGDPRVARRQDAAGHPGLTADSCAAIRRA